MVPWSDSLDSIWVVEIYGGLPLQRSLDVHFVDVNARNKWNRRFPPEKTLGSAACFKPTNVYCMRFFTGPLPLTFTCTFAGLARAPSKTKSNRESINNFVSKVINARIKHLLFIRFFYSPTRYNFLIKL